MSKCKNYREKLIYFDDLDSEVQAEVKAHLKTCANCRNDFDKFRRILNSLKNMNQNVHISEKFLARYVVYQFDPNEPDYDGVILTDGEVNKIRGHLTRCDDCRKKFEEMQQEFQSIESYLEGLDLPDVFVRKIEPPTPLKDRISSALETVINGIRTTLTPAAGRYVLIPATVIAVLLAIFLFLPVFQSGSNNYFKVAALQDTRVSYLTRGGGSGSLHTGLFEFNEGNFSSAIVLLEQYIESNPDDPNRNFAEYVCGISYLYEVNKNLRKGLQPEHYRLIEKGMKHLQTVLSGSDNPRLLEDANWYMAKAYLMKDDIPVAISYFEKILKLNGRRYQQAKDILRDLKNILTSAK